jgi:hypothetical protein
MRLELMESRGFRGQVRQGLVIANVRIVALTLRGNKRQWKVFSREVCHMI